MLRGGATDERCGAADAFGGWLVPWVREPARRVRRRLRTSRRCPGRLRSHDAVSNAVVAAPAGRRRVAGLVLAGGMLGLLRLTGGPLELVAGPGRTDTRRRHGVDAGRRRRQARRQARRGAHCRSVCASWRATAADRERSTAGAASGHAATVAPAPRRAAPAGTAGRRLGPDGHGTAVERRVARDPVASCSSWPMTGGRPHRRRPCAPGRRRTGRVERPRGRRPDHRRGCASSGSATSSWPSRSARPRWSASLRRRWCCARWWTGRPTGSWRGWTALATQRVEGGRSRWYRSAYRCAHPAATARGG